MNVRRNVVSLCAVGMTALLMSGCVDTGNPIAPAPDSPMDMVTDGPDERPDTPDVEPDVDPDADMDPAVCNGECPADRCVDNVCAPCTTEVGCTSPQVCKTSDDPAQNECVQCLNSTQCAGNPAGEVCDESTNTCVGCLDSTQCITAAAPQCNNQVCGACSDDDGCTGIDGAPRCNAGACVQCIADADCNGTSCVNNQCTTTTLNSVQQCLTCQSDSECAADHKCVNLSFGEGANQKQIGNFCLQVEVSGTACPRPYRAVIQGRASLNDPTLRNYCGINEALTTCAAVLQRLDAGNAPDCTSDDMCGLPGEDDGVCGDVLGLGDKCTYRCDNVNQCGESGATGMRACLAGVCN